MAQKAYGEYEGKIFDRQIVRRLYDFTKPYRTTFYFIIFLTLLLGVLGPLKPYLIQKTIDGSIAYRDLEGLRNMTLLLVGVQLAHALTQYAHTYLSGWLGQSVIRDLRIQLYRHILSLKLRFFDRTQIGRLVTRNISDIETLSDVFTNGLAAMMGDVLQVFFILILMFQIDWRLTLVSLATLPLLLISTYIFKEKIKKSFSDVRTAVANLNTFVQEHITGMNVVQIFGSEGIEYRKFRDINRNHLNANLRSVLYYSIYFPVAEVISATGIGLAVWYGAGGVLEDQVTFGELVAFIMFIQMMFRPLRTIADRFNTLQLGIVSSQRITRLLDRQEHIADQGEHKPDCFQGEVTFQHVWFAYDEETFVLKDIDFSVEAGHSVALVGATGAGKSSIINLLTRFYEINAGQIRVDNRPASEYDLNHLRENIGVVMQDVFLFSDTIYNNIALGNPSITRERVWETAQMLGADRFIERLPGQLDYNVMERGATLSVGQRQLISFIRVMVYDPAIIILDEATSSVDSETEELIQEAIEALMSGRTSIVIAHRLSTIRSADQIIVLEKGEIVEKGTHQTLLERDGHYARLHRMQYKNTA